MAPTNLPVVFVGEDNETVVGQLDTAWQTTVNGATLLAGSEIDVRAFKSLLIVLENITNDATFWLIGSNDEDFEHRQVVWNYAMTAGANVAIPKLYCAEGIGEPGAGATAPSVLHYRFYKFEVYSTVGGAHGSVRARYTARY